MEMGGTEKWYVVIIWVHWDTVGSMLVVSTAVEEYVLQMNPGCWLEIWRLSPMLHSRQQKTWCHRSFSSIVAAVAGGAAWVLCYLWSPDSLGHTYQAVVRTIPGGCSWQQGKLSRELHNIETKVSLPPKNTVLFAWGYYIIYWANVPSSP